MIMNNLVNLACLERRPLHATAIWDVQVSPKVSPLHIAVYPDLEPDANANCFSTAAGAAAYCPTYAAVTKRSFFMVVNGQPRIIPNGKILGNFWYKLREYIFGIIN